MSEAKSTSSQSRYARHWINGEWHDSEHKGTSVDPATGETIGYYALAMENETRLAVQSASRAFTTTDWKHNRELRSRVLHEMAEQFEAHAGQLQEILSLENGKIRSEAQFEISLAAPGLRYAASLIYADYGRAAQWSEGKFSMVLREALGVAGISVPWNSPVALMVRSLAPALAAGCTTVIKMPGQTAQTNALLASLLSKVKSLPEGVVNIVTGEFEVLDYLVRSPLVPTISFTGSTKTGRAISETGAAQLKRFGLELGGKTPIVIFDDADLSAALPKIEKALTTFAGQFCMTGSRLLVQRTIANEIKGALIKRLEAVKVAPAADPESQMGPLISRDNVHRVEAMVETAIAKGAIPLVRGGIIKEGPLANGAFYRPTLLEVSDPKAAIVQEEVFGPVLTLQIFDTETDAIVLANDSEFGLAASIWTGNGDRALRVAGKVEAGTIWINDWAVMRDEFEEGGYKQSGKGRLRGVAQLEDFMDYKHIVMQPGVSPR